MFDPAPVQHFDSRIQRNNPFSIRLTAPLYSNQGNGSIPPAPLLSQAFSLEEGKKREVFGLITPLNHPVGGKRAVLKQGLWTEPQPSRVVTPS